MTNRFMISVAAAALIAGTGFANAQGAGGATQGGSTAQQHGAPSAGGTAAPTRESAPTSGMTTGQSEKAAPAGKQVEDLKGGKAQQNTGGKDMKAEGRDNKEKATVGQAPEKSGTTTQREDKMGSDKMGRHDDKMGADKTGAQGQKGSMEQKGAQTSPSGSPTTTTGNAATSARVAAPPAEKQTQIVSAIKSERIQETNVNVNVSIGTVLPASVRFVPLPPRIVEIYPEWRGYEVVLIHGRYVIVRPQTREIVYIIEG